MVFIYDKIYDKTLFMVFIMIFIYDNYTKLHEEFKKIFKFLVEFIFTNFRQHQK